MTEKKKMTKPQRKRLIDNAVAHFETIIAGGLMGPIKVPEWDTEVYYKSTTTMAQEAAVIELTQQGKTTEGLVVQLIIKALDADGNPLFDMGDKHKLMRATDPAVILRIVTSMNNDIKEKDDKAGN